MFIVAFSVKGGIDKRNLAATKNDNQDPSEIEKQGQAKKRRELLSRVVDIVGIISFILILFVGYANFGSRISDFFKFDATTDTPTAPSNSKTTPGSTSTPTQQTAPTYQAPKQMYYSINCSGCWAESCPRNGYTYNGYDSYYYSYYTSLCRSCSCNNLNGRSFWK
jgi:hypothetical protein